MKTHPEVPRQDGFGVELERTRLAQAGSSQTRGPPPSHNGSLAHTNLVAWVLEVLEGGLSSSCQRVECVWTEVQSALETREEEEGGRPAKLKEGTKSDHTF